jgi:Rrf2 family transcriptional regulator, nitric oxide-sensitive transcriptional repressor
MYVRAKGEQLSTVDEIAKTYGVSRHHITKVVHHLGRRGYLCNARGKRGGIALGREPSTINIGTLVRELEGDLGLVECYRQRSCCLEPVCLLRSPSGFPRRVEPVYARGPTETRSTA